MRVVSLSKTVRPPNPKIIYLVNCSVILSVQDIYQHEDICPVKKHVSKVSNSSSAQKNSPVFSFVTACLSDNPVGFLKVYLTQEVGVVEGTFNPSVYLSVHSHNFGDKI